MTETSEANSSKGGSFTRRLNDLVHQGNVRHLVCTRKDTTIVDLPLTAVVVGAVLAPWLVVIGVLVALLTATDMRVVNTEARPPEPPPGAETPVPESTEDPAAEASTPSIAH